VLYFSKKYFLKNNNMKLRLRLPGDPNAQTVELPDDTLVKELNKALAEKVGQPPEAFDILFGIPPKRINQQPAEFLDKMIKDAFGPRGEVLVIQPASADGQSTIKRGHTDGKYIPPIETRNTIFVKHDVPGDNSCLFHSMGWILDMKAPELRKLVADTVVANPEKYTQAFLGSHPRTYAQWIQDPNSWGGAIEIDLLSFTFATEICVLDMTSKKPQIFGQQYGFTTRSFVVYTGNHYDAAGVGDSMDGGHKLMKQFNSRDKRPMEIAEDYLQGRIKAVSK
jgi:ubiquitin thioesterase OTU1